jgi:hypothetical protein
MSHKDSPITYRSLMRTHKVDFSKEDSWVMSSIMASPVSFDGSREQLGHILWRSCHVIRFLKRLQDFR